MRTVLLVFSLLLSLTPVPAQKGIPPSEGGGTGGAVAGRVTATSIEDDHFGNR